MSTAGLTVAEAERRLSETGRNEVTRLGRVTIASGLMTQLRDPLMLVLLAACALTVVTGDVTDTVVIAVVVVANTTVGVIQEVRADHAITALSGLSAPSVCPCVSRPAQDSGPQLLRDRPRDRPRGRRLGRGTIRLGLL